MCPFEDQLFRALQAAGMTEIPEQFSVVPRHQEIPQSVLTQIGEFIQNFDQITTRFRWQETVTANAPAIAHNKRPEVCFFSAWDFHLPPNYLSDWQLIEFNDNGSGLLFAGLINRIFYDLSRLNQRQDLHPPMDFATLMELIARLVEAEARCFFGEVPQGLFLILDDTESLHRGKFRQELVLLCNHWQQRGWQVAIASPPEIQWQGQLMWQGQEVRLIVNRSTDFFWQAEEFMPLRTAYLEGTVYVAPNPFTYATRSDKRLLEFLSLPDWDEILGIQPQERLLMSAHVPETYLIQANNVDAIAQRKAEFFFKPLYGFAGRGVLTSDQVGRSRLHRFLKHGEHYVAQKRAAKSSIPIGDGDQCSVLWTDLRVWAYRGEIFSISGRASCHPDRLDLSPPAGWLPTYALA